MRVMSTNPVFKRGTLVKTLVPAMSIALLVLFNPGITFNEFSDVNPEVKVADINSKADVLAIYKDFRDDMDRMNSNGFGLFRGNGFVDRTLSGDTATDTPDAPLAPTDGDALKINESTEQADDYSETNIQVEGVDEIDNVKTDGTFIYSISNGKVIITLAYPALNLSVYKTIEFATREECIEEFCYYEYPTGMYVDDDNLIIVTSKSTYTNWIYYEEQQNNDSSTSEDEDKPDVAPAIEPTPDTKEGFAPTDSSRNMPYWNNSDDTAVYVYNKSNDFELTSSYVVSGSMIGTRKIGDDLFIITNEHFNYNMVEENKEIEILPTYYINGEEFTSNYEDLIYIEGTDPYGFTNIYGINLTDNEIDVESILGGSSHNLYVSNNNIYTVDQRYYFGGLIERTLNTVSSDYSEAELVTTISKFSLTENDVELTATGEVKGNPVNQFSMDEYKGNFRITTTTGWGQDVMNRLYVLDEKLSVISVVGETKEDMIGKPEERLQSTRFVGDIVYLVTFRQTDPFYVFDLSNPEEPKKLGELEITGYSSYIQQIDSTHVLGIGFEANDDGRVTGMKLSVYEIDYDVVDENGLISVEEIHKQIIGNGENNWNWSSVTYNHKDLMFNMSKGILGFPLSQTISSGNYWESQSGFMLYDFSLEDGFVHKGYATHGKTDDYDYIYKGLFLDNNLYTISNNRIAVSSLDAVEKIIEIIDVNR